MTDPAESPDSSQIQNWRTELRRALEKYFSEEDIELLCFDLNVPYDYLSGTNLPLKIVALITYLDQRGRIAELIDACSKQRENVDWEALKQAALADPGQADPTFEATLDAPAADADQQPAASPAAGRSRKTFIANLPNWTAYVVIAMVFVLAGLLLARFVFFPAADEDVTPATPTEIVIVAATETTPTPSPTTTTEAPAGPPTATPDGEQLSTAVLPTETEPPPTPGPSPSTSPTPSPSPSTSPTPSPSPSPTPSPSPSPANTSTPTATPTIALTRGAVKVRELDRMRMRYVPAGSFLMGSEERSPLTSDEAPAHEVTLSAFWIDETEVSNAQYAMCAADGFCQTIELDQTSLLELGDPAHPAVRVNYRNASRYCTWAGGQLPTEAQWEYAARGPDSRLFPWGEGEPECDQARFLGCDPRTARVDSHPANVSWVGVLNMAGNVYEWCSDWYGQTYYQDDASAGPDPEGPEEGEVRVLRGGSWYDDASFLRAADRYRADPAYRGDAVGFRCIVVAEDVADQS